MEISHAPAGSLGERVMVHVVVPLRAGVSQWPSCAYSSTYGRCDKTILIHARFQRGGLSRSEHLVQSHVPEEHSERVPGIETKVQAKGRSRSNLQLWRLRVTAAPVNRPGAPETAGERWVTVVGYMRQWLRVLTCTSGNRNWGQHRWLCQAIFEARTLTVGGCACQNQDISGLQTYADTTAIGSS